MRLYELYKKNKLDLSPFGIEKGDKKSDYFCTPKGAEIIGWTGVDGIHYCFIKDFGEMVFAINPMGLPGKHAFPVSCNFDDFIRLLLSCGQEAALEQAHVWTREKYDEYVKDNPISRESRDFISHLTDEYRLTPIDDPYKYLKEIYDEFDFSKIRYRADYYEWVPREECPKPKVWEVRYEGGVRAEGERKSKAGTEFTIGRSFEWDGRKFCIPAGYICSKGLVLDICFENTDGVNANNFRLCVTVNGNKMTEKRGSILMWIREGDLLEGQENNPDAALAVEHYSLDPTKSWTIIRSSFQWATKTKPKLKSLKIELAANPVSLPGKRFRVSGVSDSVEFVHPLTGVTHTLTVTEYKRDITEFDRSYELLKDYDFPKNHVVMTFNVTPELPRERFIVSDIRPNERPRKCQTADEKYDFVSMSVGIIGGADGPTAILFGPKKDDVEKHVALSALTFEPVETVDWVMTFREKTVDDISVDLI
ncbi:MAG: sodium ion-translocating decarboxylase subunit beta [Ruminococcaceae bacterium]|nr:sodium ion-translocating decarboxylase subunit beta [Oscillospiraceae bacterium]